jgi:hypothetical protein
MRSVESHLPMNCKRILPLLLITGVFISGCAPRVLDFPTRTPHPSLTPTETVIWFPATPTQTPMPTRAVTPTPEQLTGVGAVALVDDFSLPSLWQPLKRTSGEVAFGAAEQDIAILQPGGYLLSLRNSPQLIDFYLEITASPSLCQDGDSYGLLLRATSIQDYIRFAINCDGYLRVERIRSGEVTVLQDWTGSSQVRAGSPQTFRLGVWARNTEMRFFVDGIYQFTTRDTVFTRGGVGIFARSAGQSSVSVAFKDLVVHELEGGAPIPTMVPTKTQSPQPAATK